MPLFQIQHPDRPAYVVAANYAEAEKKWRTALLKETDNKFCEPPDSIIYVWDDARLIINADFEQVGDSLEDYFLRACSFGIGPNFSVRIFVGGDGKVTFRIDAKDNVLEPGHFEVVGNRLFWKEASDGTDARGTTDS